MKAKHFYFFNCRIGIVFFLLTFSISVSAQNPPYDVFPKADPPYYRIRYEASVNPSELAFPVSYTIWIPPGVKNLRGVIVHQHGCGEGSCATGLSGAFDLHWQALAKKQQSALLSPSYEQSKEGACELWCDPRNGSDKSFQKSLVDLGVLSGHSELAKVPWALWGHSGGGAWVGFMTLLHPDRVAAVWMNSGIPIITDNLEHNTTLAMDFPDEALKIPMMCNLGTEEGVTVKEGIHAKRWLPTEYFFNQVRKRGGLIGIAIDPLTSHPTGNQRYLAIPWFDACLDSRLPIKQGNTLKPMTEKAAWFAPVLGTKAESRANYNGDTSQAIWLPNETVAKAWEHYVRDTKIPDSTSPPAPFNLKSVDGQLSWNAEADLESGIAYFIIERDGKTIATLTNEPVNPLSRPVFQGMNNSDSPKLPLKEMQFTDTETISGKKHTYKVISVNTAGLKSE